MRTERFAVIIVGAGPSGLSCALDLHESRISYVVLERNPELGGQLVEIENTIRDFAAGLFENGNALKQQLAAQCQQLGINIRYNSPAENINLARKSVACAGIVYESDVIVMATGCRARKLVVPGIARAANDVFYYSEHNLDKLSERPIAIVGGGDNALMDAVQLAQTAPIVYLINRSNRLKARADVVQMARSNERIKLLLEHELAQVISEDGKMKSVSVFDRVGCLNHTLEVERLLIRAGSAPNTEQVKGQVRMDEQGRIYIDQWCSTSAHGFYACGDISSPGYARLATALGHGSLAALAIRTNRTPQNHA
ncbi:MAG TPA: NAD(P)/FAD-dependent oxidoreductase [Planktothrix sp.]|jgi:thioredoxin reductase